VIQQLYCHHERKRRRLLSAKEARRVFVMEEVVEEMITVREAAACLNLSKIPKERAKA